MFDVLTITGPIFLLIGLGWAAVRFGVFEPALILTMGGAVLVIVLAILMPIVASMGGIAGSQTLTVVVRGLALGHVNSNNLRWLLSKEFLVGALNALLWAVVIGIIAGWWFHDPRIGYIIAAAMVINLVMAAVVGTLLPVTLKALHIDPALAGGVVLTTFTDVVGFFAFLGLATLFYF